jgi:hypothetical protein
VSPFVRILGKWIWPDIKAADIIEIYITLFSLRLAFLPFDISREILVPPYFPVNIPCDEIPEFRLVNLILELPLYV